MMAPLSLRPFPAARVLVGLVLMLAVLLVPASCAGPEVPEGGRLDYARLLRLEDSEGATLATVVNPWDTTAVLHQYVLVARGSRPPSSTPRGATVVSVPLERAVSATSLHACLALRLDALGALAGVMDAPYIVAPELRAALKSEGGGLDDFGSSATPDVERLVAARADGIFVSPFENAGYGPLEGIGVPLIECADYMETTPLGRAEWMRFYGRLLGRADEADRLFEQEASAYAALCRAAADAACPPSAAPSGSSPDAGAPPPPAHGCRLLVGQRQGQSWSVPAAGSYLGRLYADAGAAYVFASEGASGSVALDFERAYALGRDADVWLITYGSPQTMTYATLAADDARYTRFRPYAERHVWACNTLERPYYDVLPFAPATLLREVMAIVRPGSVGDYVPRYFSPLAR